VNSYSAPNFNLDTSTNVAGLTALKGSAPALADKIYIYNGATLTVESALAILLISLGETSSGAAPAGQRVGHLAVNAGVHVTFAGAASAANSGLKSNPASAAAESKGSTFNYSAGTAAAPVVFDNQLGTPSSSYQWQIAFNYGVIAAGTLAVKNTWGTPFNPIPWSTGYTTAAGLDFGTLSFVGLNTAGGANPYLFLSSGSSNTTLPINLGDLTVDLAGMGDAAMVWLLATSSGHAYNVNLTRRSLKVLPAAANRVHLYDLDIRPVPGGASMYCPANRVSAADIRPTRVAPANLAAADPAASGELTISWTNAASYAAGDLLVVVNNAGGAVLGYLDATAGSGRIAGLTNGQSYTVKARATSDPAAGIFSAYSNTAAATPTAGAEPAAPTLAVEDDGTGDSVTATVDGDAGVTNKVYHRAPGAAAWTLGGSRSGDGQVPISGLAELARYQFVALSESGAARSLPSNVAAALVTDGAASPETRLQAAVADLLRTDAALAGYAPDWPGHVYAAPPDRHMLGRMPAVEVGRVELVRAEGTSADAEELVARLVLRAHLLEMAPAGPAEIHDFVGAILRALKAEPELALPELVAGFSATAAAPAYDAPLWTAEITLAVRLALAPASRGPVS
jgi:hypothetical protein